MKSLVDIDISNKNLVVRVDMNVPIRDKKIQDPTRIKACLPTINYALEKNCKVLLISHLGRPAEGTREDKFSLAPVSEYLSDILDEPVSLEKDMSNTDIFKSGPRVKVLENIRFYKGEKNNDSELGKSLGLLGDVYVFDAFGTSHRKQASTYEAIIQSKEACAGFLLKNEVEALNKSLQNPPKPNIAIIGGAKVSSKLGLIKNLKDKTDFIIVGGGITNTFLKASGHEVGSSLVEDSMLDIAREILESGKVLLPSRVIV
jgi:phosphoglycerate kinase